MSDELPFQELMQQVRAGDADATTQIVRAMRRMSTPRSPFPVARPLVAEAIA